jgi:hypothetical protein
MVKGRFVSVKKNITKMDDEIFKVSRKYGGPILSKIFLKKLFNRLKSSFIFKKIWSDNGLCSHTRKK